MPEAVIGNSRASRRLTSAPPEAFVDSTSIILKQTTPSTPPDLFSFIRPTATHHHGGPQRARQVRQVHRAYHQPLAVSLYVLRSRKVLQRPVQNRRLVSAPILRPQIIRMSLT